MADADPCPAEPRDLLGIEMDAMGEPGARLDIQPVSSSRSTGRRP